jgi:hypothetical protein
VSTSTTVELKLNPEERQIVDLLQKELGLKSTEEVLRLLLRQALQRRAVVCPTCGHLAQQTERDVASCAECLSVLRLSEGIWQAIQSHPPR